MNKYSVNLVKIINAINKFWRGLELNFNARLISGWKEVTDWRQVWKRHVNTNHRLGLYAVVIFINLSGLKQQIILHNL
jgi:hypothetical protein